MTSVSMLPTLITQGHTPTGKRRGRCCPPGAGELGRMVEASSVEIAVRGWLRIKVLVGCGGPFYVGFYEIPRDRHDNRPLCHQWWLSSRRRPETVLPAKPDYPR